MKISHEIPKQLFPIHDLINDYPYVLAHLLTDKYHYDKEYAEFYKRKLQGCEFSILDNSAYELGKSVDIEILHQLGEEYKPSHIVVPDHYANMHETLSMVNEYSELYGEISTPKFFAVIQGQDYPEYIQCLDNYIHNPFIDIIGITFRTLSDGTTREQFLEDILSVESPLLKNKKIHLLGCSTPNEFLEMNRSLLKRVHSVDTSSPVVNGWNLNEFTAKGYFGQKPKEKLADNLDINLSEDQKQMIYSNVKHFRNYFK